MSGARAKCMALAKKLGATIEVEGGEDYVVLAIAPAGKEWLFDCQLHNLVAHREYNEPVSAAWADLYMQMGFGLADGTCAECRGMKA